MSRMGSRNVPNGLDVVQKVLEIFWKLAFCIVLNGLTSWLTFLLTPWAEWARGNISRSREPIQRTNWTEWARRLAEWARRRAEWARRCAEWARAEWARMRLLRKNWVFGIKILGLLVSSSRFWSKRWQQWAEWARGVRPYSSVLQITCSHRKDNRCT